MAKTNKTKTATTTPKATPPAPIAKRNRGKVLVLKTANELLELIGPDTPVGVSVKSLVTVVNKRNAETIRQKIEA